MLTDRIFIIFIACLQASTSTCMIGSIYSIHTATYIYHKAIHIYYFCSLAALVFKDAMNIVNLEYSYQTVLHDHTLSAKSALLGEGPSTTVWLSSYLLGHHWFPIQYLFDFDPQKFRQDCGSWFGKLTTTCIAKVLVSCPSTRLL